MKILIIGGNGFIGTNLCRTLLEKNEEVYSFDIQLPAVSIHGVRYIVGDFLQNYLFSIKRATSRLYIILTRHAALLFGRLREEKKWHN